MSDDKNNIDVTSGQPDGNEPPGGYRERDIFDYIDETTAAITDSEIDQRLQQTLREAGYACADKAVSELSLEMLFTGTDAKDISPDHNPADAQFLTHDWASAAQRLLVDRVDEIRAARQEACQIIAKAREAANHIREEAEAVHDAALTEAAQIVSEARAQADEMIEVANQHREQAAALLEQTRRYPAATRGQARRNAVDYQLARRALRRGRTSHPDQAELLRMLEIVADSGNTDVLALACLASLAKNGDAPPSAITLALVRAISHDRFSSHTREEMRKAFESCTQKPATPEAVASAREIKEIETLVQKLELVTRNLEFPAVQKTGLPANRPATDADFVR